MHVFGMNLFGKIRSLVRQAWYRWLEFCALNRADRAARAEMSAYFRQNLQAAKWTTLINWPFCIVQDQAGEYWYLPANGGRRRPHRWMLRRHLREQAAIRAMIARLQHHEQTGSRNHCCHIQETGSIAGSNHSLQPWM